MTAVLALPFLEEALAPPEDISVSEWAERYRVMPAKNQAMPGPWQHRAAYLVEIMDSISTKGVEFVTLMKSPQTGGSEALLNGLAWSMTTKPGPTAYIMPTETAKLEFIRDRIRPMLANSPHPLLRRWVTPKLWERSRIDMPDMSLFALHAGSATELASRPIQFVYLDEVDKYRDIPKEGHPEDLAIKRTITYAPGGRRTIVRVSTPTVETGRIYVAWLSGDQRRWHVPCAECGTWQVLNRSSIRWPSHASSGQVLRDKSAWLECCDCKARYDDKGRDELVARGKWVPDACSISDDGEIVGDTSSTHRSYHIWAAMSPWVSLHEIAAQDLASKDNVALRHDVSNNVYGEPFYELDQSLAVEDLTGLAAGSSYDRGVAPEWAQLVILGVDVQKGPELPWLAIACGLNEQYAVLDWGSLYGVESFDLFEHMLRTQEWPTETGEMVGIRLACIDHEGGLYTQPVEDLASRNGDVLRMVSGRATATQPIVLGRVDRHGRRKSEFRGLPLYSLDTTYHKDRAARMMGTAAGQRGSVQLPTDADERLLRQLSSEAKVIPRQGKNRAPRWQVKHGFRQNHYWDCLIYGLAGAMMIGLHTGMLEAAAGSKERELASSRARDDGDDVVARKYWDRAKSRSRKGSYWGRR